MKSSSLWMATLTLTAILLGVILLASKAQAAQINYQGSFTLMTSGAPGGDEALYIVDKATQKMLVYSLTGNKLDLITKYNLR